MVTITLSLVLAFSAGCTQVGDYQRPKSNIPTQWKYRAAIDDALQAGKIDWPDFFRDRRLQMLISKALTNNQDMQIALARVSETRAQYAVVNADQLPGVGLIGSRMATKIPAAFTGTDRPVTTERSELSLNMVSYELDFWGRIAKLSEASRAAYLASDAAARSLRISLIAVVASLYFNSLETEERLNITRALIETRQKRASLTRHAMEKGAVARSDYLITESAVNSAKGELAILENQQASNDHFMTLLTGNSALDLPAGLKLNEQDIQGTLTPGIPSEVLYARPDVVAAEYRLKEAHANIAAARTAFLPRILLTAGLGLASRNLAGLFSAGTGNWNFQPTISIPLFDNGRTAGYVEIAEARKISAVADYERTIQQAFREVADLLSARASLVEQRRAADATLQARQERLLVAESRFKAGSISNIEVLDARHESLAAQQANIQILAAQLSNMAQLYKALGGGNIDEG